MNVDELKKNLHDVIERYRNKAEFTGEVCRDVMARDCLQVVEELEAENEQLKRELKQTEVQDQVVIDGLRKENAKLKCLALRGMSVYAAKRAKMWETGQDVSPMGHKHEIDWIKLNILWYIAYRKAKKALREGK